MQAWNGWTAAIPTMRATPATPTTRAFTWAEWRAWQQRTLPGDERCHEQVRFSDVELARLSFLRWLYQAGRLGQQGYGNV